jgi:hypothetical protein
MSKKHHVSFVALKPVREPARVAFTTKTGERVVFNGHKTLKVPAQVHFMAKNKP